MKRSLKRKFYLVFGLIFLVVFGSGAVSLLTYSGISRQYNNIATDIIPGTLIITDIKTELMELASHLSHLIANDSGDVDSIARTSEEIQELMVRYHLHEKRFNGDEFETARNIILNCSDILIITKQIVPIVKSGDKSGLAVEMCDQTFDLMEETEHQIDRHAEIYKKKLAGAGKMLNASLEISHLSLYTAVTLTILIVLGGSILISRSVLKPLIILRNSAAQIGVGDLEHRVNISTGDEIEALGEQFNLMAEALSRSRKFLEDEVAERTRELKSANEGLQKEIHTREQTEESLRVAKLQAEEANRMKSTFLANMSHEIRTPLNAIIGFSESLSDSDNLEDIQKQGKVILTEAETLLSLINDLLDNAKIEAGKLELEMRPFDLYKMLKRVINSLSIRAYAKGLELNLDIDERVPQYVIGDDLRIHQVLMNLLVNAVKFTEKGSVTLKLDTINLENEDCKISFSVIDTGIGIAEDRQKKIFESYTQAEASTTRKFGGTGLGTTISRQLIELMGYKIELESEPGKGSTFWFVLDFKIASGVCEYDEEETNQNAVCSSNTGCKGNILVAEDHLPNQKVVSLHLEKAGYKVTVVENGRLAVEAATSKSYDLILMDIQMPEMNGYDATRAIRSCDSPCSKIPILALTANADGETYRQCKEAGMDDVTTKPVRRKTLLEVMDKWLCKRESRQVCSDDGNVTENISTDSKCDDVKPIDIKTVLEEFDGDSEVVNMLIERFVEEAEWQVKNIAEALEGQDLETVRQEAHKIRGAAGNLVAVPLSLAAGTLEDMIRSGQIDNAVEKVEKLQKEFARLKEYV